MCERRADVGGGRRPVAKRAPLGTPAPLFSLFRLLLLFPSGPFSIAAWRLRAQPAFSSERVCVPFPVRVYDACDSPAFVFFAAPLPVARAAPSFVLRALRTPLPPPQRRQRRKAQCVQPAARTTFPSGRSKKSPRTPAKRKSQVPCPDACPPPVSEEEEDGVGVCE
jgi:hypothetical protein